MFGLRFEQAFYIDSGCSNDSAGGLRLSSTAFLFPELALRRGRAMPRSTRFLRARILVVVAAALVASNCDSATSPTAPPLAPVLTTVTALWDSNFNFFASQDVASLPAVIVRDQFGHGMAGISVSFAVTDGGGTLRMPDTITSADGIAKLGGWTLGPLPGLNAVTATVSKSLTLSFILVARDVRDACLGCWDY
jgi:hypothetical protein